MIKTRAVSAMLAFGSLTGCVPFPNLHYFAPAVAGIVLRDGQPVAGAQIRVASTFSSTTRVGSTQPSGRFSVEPIRELRLTATLVGDPLYGFEVEIVVDGERYAGYSEYGTGYASPALQLSCDLTSRIKRLDKVVHCTQASESG